MKILSIQNYNNTNANKNPNFGVKLEASIDVPKFVIKQAANYALSNNQNINSMTQLHYKALQTEFLKLQKIVEEFEPKNMKVRLDLTEKARAYANNLRLDGHLFDEEAPGLICSDLTRETAVALPVEDLSPTPDAFYKIKFIIKKLTKARGYDNY